MKNTLALITVLILILATYLYMLPAEDKIDQQLKSEIKTALSSSWGEGIQRIDELLEGGGLSGNDQAYLLSLKGTLKLQQGEFTESQISLSRALELNLELENFQLAGQNSLDLSDYYLALKDYNKHEEHIKNSIEYFKKAGNFKDQSDARMALANMYQLKRQFPQAIDEYISVIEDAKENDDQEGEMLAVNNLARLYQSMGKMDEALEFAKVGHELTEKIGNPNYINSSKIFLNQLYQQQNQLDRALISIQESLRDRVGTDPLDKYLNQVVEYTYILIMTMNLDRAEVLLNQVMKYVELKDSRRGRALLVFYQGLIKVYQDQLNEAQELFVLAFELYNQSSLYEKKSLLVAFVALSNQLTEAGLDVKSPAELVYRSSQPGSKEKAVAALSLAYFYHSQNDQAKTNEWGLKVEESLDENMFWETKLMLNLKRMLADPEHVEGIDQKLTDLKQRMKGHNSLKLLDNDIYQSVLKTIKLEIDLKNP